MGRRYPNNVYAIPSTILKRYQKTGQEVAKLWAQATKAIVTRY